MRVHGRRVGVVGDKNATSREIRTQAVGSIVGSWKRELGEDI